MKFNTTIEFTDQELRDYAADLSRRWIFDGLGYLGNMVEQLFQNVDPRSLDPLLKAVQSAMAGGGRPQRPVPQGVVVGGAPSGGPFGPPPGYGYCGTDGCFPFTPGYPTPQPPWGAHRRARVIPFPGASGPFGGEPGPDIMHQHCFPIEETSHLEAGWGCHLCATYNALQRPVCRRCGHPRCYAKPVDAEYVPAPADPAAEAAAHPANRGCKCALNVQQARALGIPLAHEGGCPIDNATLVTPPPAARPPQPPPPPPPPPGGDSSPTGGAA
jgi:hypothetical protein